MVHTPRVPYSTQCHLGVNYTKIARKETLDMKSLAHHTNQVSAVHRNKILAWASKVNHASSIMCDMSRASAAILVAYVTLFSVQYVLVKASQTAGGNYPYNSTLVVTATELLKLLIATAFLLKKWDLSELRALFRRYWRVPLLYVLPSSLYCISNNLVFLNLQSFDPITYNVLLQLRIVLTGILFQLFFKRVLSRIQWLSLIGLTAGCVVKQLGAKGPTGRAIDGLLQLVNWKGVFLLSQILCSCLAGILNEVFLKDDTGPIMLNNFCMYSTSVAANLFAVTIRGSFYDIIDTEQLSQILCIPHVLAIVVNGAASGMMIPIFLSHFNSITRVFMVSVELALIAFISWVVFGTPINLVTLATILIVTVATVAYVRNPVTENDDGKEINIEQDKRVCPPARCREGIANTAWHSGLGSSDRVQEIVTRL
ncbi:CMP-sialic acid transporter 1-like [Tropilaelaps mercedesae]|uniref:CMP-sialic acid transporter 1-like n=1 Tax=Tropilaelaps mercedesae TaxID=418985 RepID=A0A1V9WY45_9ACAR|nr:CMP-sialic acid transporter 1-like [Tropilaelaps mercedesae]